MRGQERRDIDISINVENIPPLITAHLNYLSTRSVGRSLQPPRLPIKLNRANYTAEIADMQHDRYGICRALCLCTPWQNKTQEDMRLFFIASQPDFHDPLIRGKNWEVHHTVYIMQWAVFEEMLARRPFPVLHS